LTDDRRKPGVIPRFINGQDRTRGGSVFPSSFKKVPAGEFSGARWGFANVALWLKARRESTGTVLVSERGASTGPVSDRGDYGDVALW